MASPTHGRFLIFESAEQYVVQPVGGEDAKCLAVSRSSGAASLCGTVLR
jgi:hypothetical protein